MADFNDVMAFRKRLNEESTLSNEQIQEVMSRHAPMMDLSSMDEAREFVFRLRTELIDYITTHGLVDGLLWDGELQPVQNSKIVITSEMIQIITDNFGYLRESEALTLIEFFLTENHYVSDEFYTHTDNNLTDEMVEKLDGIEVGAESNLVNDVTFNGVSIVTNKVAELVITPSDIKSWYESNPDTNAFTDALKELLESIPSWQESTTDTINQIITDVAILDGKVDALEMDLNEKIDNVESSLNDKIDLVESGLQQDIQDLSDDVSQQIGDLEGVIEYNKGVCDQRYEETTRRFTEQGEMLVDHETRVTILENRADITDVEIQSLKDDIEHIHSIFNLRGSVPTYADLPMSGNIQNDGYIVINDENHGGSTTIYTWVTNPVSLEEEWAYVGKFTVDLSLFYTKEEIDSMLLLITNDVSTNYYNKTESDAKFTTFEYVNNAVNNKVSKMGDIMSGDLIMGSNKVSSSYTPLSPNDLTNKKYVDDSLADIDLSSKVDKSGDTMTGDLIIDDGQYISTRISYNEIMMGNISMTPINLLNVGSVMSFSEVISGNHAPATLVSKNPTDETWDSAPSSVCATIGTIKDRVLPLIKQPKKATIHTKSYILPPNTLFCYTIPLGEIDTPADLETCVNVTAEVGRQYNVYGYPQFDFSFVYHWQQLETGGVRRLNVNMFFMNNTSAETSLYVNVVAHYF